MDRRSIRSSQIKSKDILHKNSRGLTPAILQCSPGWPTSHLSSSLCNGYHLLLASSLDAQHPPTSTHSYESTPLPSQRGTKSLSRTFSFTVPCWWNDLAAFIWNAECLTIFKRQLKTSS